MTSKLNINWLNKCRCGNRMHTVETVRGSHVRLFEDDAVKCNSCGREGVIQTCDGIATVLWETDEERAEGVTMTKSTITREQITSWMNDANYTLEEPLNADDAAAARAILAMGHELLSAMDSEPVAEVVSIYGDPEAFGEREIRPLVGIQQMPYGTKLYRHAQPASEREQVRREHAEWSQATFGNVGPVGPLKHLSKEALEAAAEPGDLSEWADMQFLMWDAQRRAGITDAQITLAMIDKLAVNKQRSWPEPKDGEPRLHIKEQPAPVAPVVPDFKKLARELVDNLVDCGGLDEGVKEKYLEWAEKTCRAAMLAATPQEVK